MGEIRPKKCEGRELTKEPLLQVFREMDEDGNGSLDAEEVARFVRKLKPTRLGSSPGICKKYTTQKRK